MITDELRKEIQNRFWKNVDRTVRLDNIVVEHRAGEKMPTDQDSAYPADYGHLETKDTIGIWVGTRKSELSSGLVLLLASDEQRVSVIVLQSCTEEEMEQINLHHFKASFGVLLIRRWGDYSIDEMDRNLLGAGT